jgi:aspartate/glutamate racemase
MVKRVIYLHTVMGVVPQFNELSRTLLPPGTEWWHIVDEMLAKVALAQGGLSPFLYRRVAEHAQAAREAGADVFQLTCSSISPCADAVNSLVDIPVLKIDAPMVEQAVDMARRIGIAATAYTALAPLAEQVRARASALGKQVEVNPVLCEGAYPAMLAGDMTTHNRVVSGYLQQMAQCNDVILLAQASMALIVNSMPADSLKVRVLTSPRMAVERLARALEM